MDPIQNPFLPGAGAQPPELTGRQSLLDQADIILGRTMHRRAAKSLVAIGLRGVGKTVLLQRIQSQSEKLGYHVCYVEAHEPARLPALIVPHIRRLILGLDRLGALNEHVKRGLRVLKSFMSSFKMTYADLEIGLDISPETGAADSGVLDLDLTELFLAVGRAAAARGVGVALLIDEIQFLTERDFSALVMALHRCVQEALPVVLVGAGLPQIVSVAGKSKSYAERMFEFAEIGPLTRSDADAALRLPVEEQGISWTDEALDMVWDHTAGYPYFIQEWGYHAWNSAAGPVIGAADVAAAATTALARLDENFFRIRFGRLTNGEREYLRAMAELGGGPHQTAAIAKVLGINPTAASPHRTRLIRKGMIYSPEHGKTAFSVPLFDRFLLRIAPHAAPSSASH